MATPALLRSRAFVIALLAGSIGCSAGDLVLPDPPGGGENVQLSKFAAGENGDNQEGTVGEHLPQPLVVQVLTERQQPAVGRRVAFVITSEAGDVTPDTAITDSRGLATTRWLLGTSPGSYTIQAQLVSGEDELQTEEFTAAARPAAPDTLSPLSPISQPGRPGQEVSTPPLVRVVDRFGNGVPDVPVAWQVITGQGQTSESISRTTADGTTSVKWVLGDRVGVHKLTATIEDATGSPATFTAIVLF